MAKLKLVTYDNDIFKNLRQVAKEVSPIEFMNPKPLLDTVDGMFRLMLNSGGIGLAANQAGVLKRIIVINVIGDFFGPMINPIIVKEGGDKTPLEEGCLSFPDKTVTVVRPMKVSVSWRDCAGNRLFGDFYGLTAKVIQHEIDHLNGIVFIDREQKDGSK